MTGQRELTPSTESSLSPSEAPGGVPATPADRGLVCAGCGHVVGPDEPLAFRCPRAVEGDDVDHLLTPVLEVDHLALSAGAAEADPFVRYRAFFHAYRLARSAGWSDERYVALVGGLEAAIAAVDGRPFAETPFGRNGALSDRLGFNGFGGVWLKDETRNVSGSHKARHLMGVMLELRVAEALGRTESDRPLAIASCGNAALAAAVVARAANRRLDVYVPTWADTVVLERLAALGANVVPCHRQPDRPGDPTYHRLRDAIAGGAVPFTCQGPENGFVIEGGETLGLEMVTSLANEGRQLDALVVQVGGGALASACALAFDHAYAAGAIGRRPRFYAVQTQGAWPLKRAFDRVVASIQVGASIPEALAYAAHHRSQFMWPWEDVPHSVAHGILDDETYDWLAIVRAMLETGGRPLVVDEATLLDANELALETTGIAADETGTAGLAGLLAMRQTGEIEPGENVAVLFTGIRRDAAPPSGTETHDAKAASSAIQSPIQPAERSAR